MEQCLALARQAKENGETAVGAIIVKDGMIVSEGMEATRGKLDPSAHAEMEAIKSACQTIGSLDLSEAILYTTVEPCFLCGFAIRTTRISRVVIGTNAGEVGALNSRHSFLADPEISNWGPPPKLLSGMLEIQARELLT